MSQMRIPEFKEPTEVAVATCIGVGAVKFPDVLEPVQPGLLEDTGPVTEFGILKHRHPFFAQVGDTLAKTDKSVSVDVFDVEPFFAAIDDSYEVPDEHRVVRSHTDSIGSRGLTLCVPFRARSVRFFASQGGFHADTDGAFDNTLPVYDTEYGVGDVIMVRQAVRKYNGREVNLGQTHHAAISHMGRVFMAIDIVADEIVATNPGSDSGCGSATVQ